MMTVTAAGANIGTAIPTPGRAARASDRQRHRRDGDRTLIHSPLRQQIGDMMLGITAPPTFTAMSVPGHCSTTGTT